MKKVLVTYWSQTGNTKKVAEAIFDSLPGDKELKPLEEVSTFAGIDLAFIGFPVMQFGPPPVVKKFLASHSVNIRIALFVTHAMLSHNEDPKKQALLEKELERCRSACSESQFAGLYHCQGELSESVADELMKTNIPMLMEFAAMRPLTIGHPSSHELKEAQDFARTIIGW